MVGESRRLLPRPGKGGSCWGKIIEKLTKLGVSDKMSTKRSAEETPEAVKKAKTDEEEDVEEEEDLGEEEEGEGEEGEEEEDLEGEVT